MRVDGFTCCLPPRAVGAGLPASAVWWILCGLAMLGLLLVPMHGWSPMLRSVVHYLLGGLAAVGGGAMWLYLYREFMGEPERVLHTDGTGFRVLSQSRRISRVLVFDRWSRLTDVELDEGCLRFHRVSGLPVDLDVDGLTRSEQVWLLRQLQALNRRCACGVPPSGLTRMCSRRK